MLTDIFAYRYAEQLIWTTYTETERRLLNQLTSVVKEVIPYYTTAGKVNEENKEKWKGLHDKLARELGVSYLSPTYYSYTQKNTLGQEFPVSGFWGWDHVCEQFMNEPFNAKTNADSFIKDRISFVELALRLRGEEVAHANANLPSEIQKLHMKVSNPARMFIPTTPELLKAGNVAMNTRFADVVIEVNERFRRARAPISYHNGFIQFATDTLIETKIAKPFWDLVADPIWSNVDIDMKEALDRRDSNDKDPAIFAAKALESAIKIVSTQKGWTRGKETGAAQFIDNLTSTSNGGFLKVWEGEMLKDYFRKVRNSVGHGPGSEPMPELTIIQTDWAIETAMSWIRTLVRRM